MAAAPSARASVKPAAANSARQAHTDSDTTSTGTGAGAGRECGCGWQWRGLGGQAVCVLRRGRLWCSDVRGQGQAAYRPSHTTAFPQRQVPDDCVCRLPSGRRRARVHQTRPLLGHCRWEKNVSASTGWRQCSGSSGSADVRTNIVWSQPEIMLYALPPCEDQRCGIGYPDFIETATGAVYVTETDKAKSRVHRLPSAYLDQLWGQATTAHASKRPQPRCELDVHTDVHGDGCSCCWQECWWRRWCKPRTHLVVCHHGCARRCCQHHYDTSTEMGPHEPQQWVRVHCGTGA